MASLFLDYIKNGVLANYKNSIEKRSKFIAKYDQFFTYIRQYDGAKLTKSNDTFFISYLIITYNIWRNEYFQKSFKKEVQCLTDGTLIYDPGSLITIKKKNNANVQW